MTYLEALWDTCASEVDTELGTPWETLRVTGTWRLPCAPICSEPLGTGLSGPREGQWFMKNIQNSFISPSPHCHQSKTYPLHPLQAACPCCQTTWWCKTCCWVWQRGATCVVDGWQSLAVASIDAMLCSGWGLLPWCSQHPRPEDTDPPLLSRNRFSSSHSIASFSCLFPHSPSLQTRHSLSLYPLNPWCQMGAETGMERLFLIWKCFCLHTWGSVWGSKLSILSSPQCQLFPQVCPLRNCPFALITILNHLWSWLGLFLWVFLLISTSGMICISLPRNVDTVMMRLV